MSASRSGLTETEREVVTALIETRAVDFRAIGDAVARFGAPGTLHLDGQDIFCGTMKRFTWLFRRPELGRVDQPAELQQPAAEPKR